jgi:hypothetical protein
MRPGGLPSPEQREILVRNMHVDGDVARAPDRDCMHHEGGASGAKVIRNG